MIIARREFKVKVMAQDQLVVGQANAVGPTSIKGSFYYASFAPRGICHGPVSVSVCVCLCLSQVGVLLKWLNVGCRNQRRMIAQGL